MPNRNTEEVVAVASPRAVFAAALVGGTLLLATIAAYLGRIPTELKAIPYYDTVGHFGLFGGLAAALDHMLGRRSFRRVPLSALIVGGYAIFDESLQSLSPLRAVDPADLAAGLIGIAVLVPLVRAFVKRS